MIEPDCCSFLDIAEVIANDQLLFLILKLSVKLEFLLISHFWSVYLCALIFYNLRLLRCLGTIVLFTWVLSSLHLGVIWSLGLHLLFAAKLVHPGPHCIDICVFWFLLLLFSPWSLVLLSRAIFLFLVIFVQQLLDLRAVCLQLLFIDSCLKWLR